MIIIILGWYTSPSVMPKVQLNAKPLRLQVQGILGDLPYLRLPKEEVSSSEGEEWDEGPKDEAVVTTARVGEGESDALEKDSDDTPLVHLAIRKRKAIDDAGDPVPSTATAADVPSASTGDVP